MLFRLLSKIADNGDNTAEVLQLSLTLSPSMFRPLTSAYMSIKHMRDLIRIRPIVKVFIENYEEIYTMVEMNRDNYFNNSYNNNDDHNDDSHQVLINNDKYSSSCGTNDNNIDKNDIKDSFNNLMLIGNNNSILNSDSKSADDITILMSSTMIFDNPNAIITLNSNYNDNNIKNSGSGNDYIGSSSRSSGNGILVDNTMKTIHNCDGGIGGNDDYKMVIDNNNSAINNNAVKTNVYVAENEIREEIQPGSTASSSSTTASATSDAISTVLTTTAAETEVRTNPNYNIVSKLNSNHSRHYTSSSSSPHSLSPPTSPRSSLLVLVPSAIATSTTTVSSSSSSSLNNNNNSYIKKRNKVAVTLDHLEVNVNVLQQFSDAERDVSKYDDVIIPLLL